MLSSIRLHLSSKVKIFFNTSVKLYHKWTHLSVLFQYHTCNVNRTIEGVKQKTKSKLSLNPVFFLHLMIKDRVQVLIKSDQCGYHLASRVLVRHKLSDFYSIFLSGRPMVKKE